MKRAKKSLSVAVRPARKRDLAKIAALLGDLAGEELGVDAAADCVGRIAKNREEAMIVACRGEEVVGLLAFRIRHNVESVSHFGEVSALVVSPECRKMGVGRLLMQEAEAMARRRKCIGLWLVSGFGREEEAHKFYEQMGLACNGKRFVKLFA